MTDPNNDDAFEPELDGFPTDIDPRRVLSRVQIEVLASEYADKARQGLNPSIDGYIERYPEMAAQIRELFPMVAALEQWKSDRESEVLRAQLPDQFKLKQLGDCRLVREIGRGGMGVVFEALEGSIERRVAVKLLPWRISMVPHRQERFEREAQTIAKLRHANIVPIFRFGRHDDYAYYVMQYVESMNLGQLISALVEREHVSFALEIKDQISSKIEDGSPTSAPTERKGLKRDSWKSFARMGAQVAQALRHAHRKGVLHNDVKPGNLLIDAAGKVFVTDFGLAEPLDSDSSDHDDAVNGTLKYMAPERFLGICDETSDVYSLGITLLELVTQQPAFIADSRSELINAINAGHVRNARENRSEIPVDLDAVISKAVSLDPDNRYQSPGEMASDLLRFINDERVAARSGRRFLGWLRRKSKGRSNS
ncbi:MAG: serine/threonine-protein kinase [Planctomycetota bacterium]|nr:serine/threonine-protein kinase [Planctomycetota bacterium]MDA1162884.1 serine/threonine-protein kinase [Planctomycetota bacterium]